MRPDRGRHVLGLTHQHAREEVADTGGLLAAVGGRTRHGHGRRDAPPQDAKDRPEGRSCALLSQQYVARGVRCRTQRKGLGTCRQP